LVTTTSTTTTANHRNHLIGSRSSGLFTFPHLPTALGNLYARTRGLLAIHTHQVES
jgi:hypothetical protein